MSSNLIAGSTRQGLYYETSLKKRLYKHGEGEI